MENLMTEAISNLIHQIRDESHSDFAALALPNMDGRIYRWHYVSGNTNQRYKQMLVKRGKGLPGMALLFGRCLTSDQQKRNGLKIDCPLMLAEGLKAAAAIPVPAAMGDNGVLIIGTRQEYSYSASELNCLQECAVELAILLQNIQLHNR